MLASIYSLSNPISTFSRLSYANECFIDPSKIFPKGHKTGTLEFLVDQANDRKEEKIFQRVMEKYLLLNNAVAENLHKIKDKDLIWLGMFNLGLESPLGFFKHVNTDDFCTKTDFATYLMDIYMQSSPEVQEAMGNIVFYRHGPFEFPFMIKEDERGVKIVNPFFEEIGKINSLLEERGKTPLGDNERYYDDDQRLENYNVAATVFSIKKFNEQVNKEPYYLETLYYIYKSKYQETLYNVQDMDEFKRLCEAAIAMNREILKQKYATIFKELDLKVYDGFFTAGNVANDVVDGIIKNEMPGLKKHIIGGMVLQDTKNIPIRGVLEAQALNRLSGYLNAKYGDIGSEPAVFKQKAFSTRHELHTSASHPYIYAGEETSDIEKELKDISADDIRKLERDIIKYQVRISPIEVVVYFLNENNFPVHGDLRADKTWQKTKQGKVMPLDISSLFDESPRMTRPSNSSQKCPFIKYINVIEKEYPFEIKKNDAAISGSVRHKIANELGVNQKNFLEKIGLTLIDRGKYCEVSIRNNFSPTQYDWNLAVGLLDGKYSETGNPLYMMAIDKIDELQDQNITIDDGGRPDAVLITGNSPIIVDFKRRVSRYYPVPSFFEQASRYGMMVINGLKLDTDRMYVAIVQTPYSSTKYLDIASDIDTKDFMKSFYVNKPLFDKGNYRHEKIRMREISLESAFMDKVKAEWISEWVMNKHMFSIDESLGLKARESYAGTLCDKCFSNTKLDYRCNYILTGRQEPWPDFEQILAEARNGNQGEGGQ